VTIAAAPIRWRPRLHVSVGRRDRRAYFRLFRAAPAAIGQNVEPQLLADRGRLAGEIGDP
jgi:hypothetical protein